jgi:UDPglucose 6-dehydrogenase
LKDNALVEIVDDQYAPCQGADALLVVTEWNQFRNPDFDRVRNALNAPVIFDGRNLFNAQTVARHGFAYFCVGRKN